MHSDLDYAAEEKRHRASENWREVNRFRVAAQLHKRGFSVIARNLVDDDRLMRVVDTAIESNRYITDAQLVQKVVSAVYVRLYVNMYKPRRQPPRIEMNTDKGWGGKTA